MNRFRASGIALLLVLLTGLLLGLSLAPSELLAQTGAIRAGDLVRIRPLGVTRHDFRSYRKGTVTELADGWLTISREKSGEPYRIATDSIRTLAVADGIEGHPVTGLMLGFFGGCGLGLAIAELTQPTPRDGYRALSGCGIGLVIGSVGGGYLGAISKSTRWAEVPLDGLQLGIGPGPRGSLQLGFKFSP